MAGIYNEQMGLISADIIKPWAMKAQAEGGKEE